MHFDIHKAGAVIIKDRKLLVTRSKGKSFFISPGGKLEVGENVFEALHRELFEELTITFDNKDVVDFGVFYAPVMGDINKVLRMDVFLVKNWQGDIKIANEIEELKWIDSVNIKDIELGSIYVHDVFPKLKELNLID